MRFTSCWDTDDWLLERNRMLRDSDGAHVHRDDAALMLRLVSGRFPGPPPVESKLFRTWIDTLWDLPASAPEWPGDAANLGKWIRYILREKERELIEGVVGKVADRTGSTTSSTTTWTTWGSAPSRCRPRRSDRSC